MAHGSVNSTGRGNGITPVILSVHNNNNNNNNSFFERIIYWADLPV